MENQPNQEAEQPQPQPANPSRLSYRYSAYFVDGLILSFPLILILPFISDVAIYNYFFTLLAIGYTVYFHVNRGATIGKSVYGLQVVQYQKSAFLQYKSAFIRELVKDGVFLIPFIGIVIHVVNIAMTGFSKEKRGIHDLLAKSQVVEVREAWSLGKQALYFLPLLAIEIVLFFLFAGNLLSMPR